MAEVTLPSPASLSLDRRFGFREVGVFTQVRRKFDCYWDVAWFQRPLALDPAVGRGAGMGDARHRAGPLRPPGLTMPPCTPEAPRRSPPLKEERGTVSIWDRLRGAPAESPAAAPPKSGVEPARRARPTPERLTSLNLPRYLREHPRAVVDVWAPWCVPCRAFGPIFARAADEWGDQVGFGKIHADHEPSLVARFGIRSIPSLLFFREGELVRTEVGVVPAERFGKLLRKVFRDLE